MAVSEVFGNAGTASVLTGGTAAVPQGTVETWSVAAVNCPTAVAGITQFRVIDFADPSIQPEIILVTNGGNGSGSWTVTRGAEGTATVAHLPGFTVIPSVTAGAMTAVGNASTATTITVVPSIADGSTDNTSTIQASLTAAGAGDTVRLLRGTAGAAYVISAPLVIPSGVTLNATGATVNLKTGSLCNMVTNYAASTANRTVADAAITATATTLTSATANFTSADVGRTVVITGAGGGSTPGPLVANITVFTNATTVTVGVAAVGTVSGAACSIYTRDTNVTLAGGTWNRGNNGGTGVNNHTFRFRHVDGLTVRDITMSTTAGKYGISPGDVTNVQISNCTASPSIASSFIQFTGPVNFADVRNIFGTTTDDFIALTPADFTAYADTCGDITNVTISGVYATTTVGGALFKSSGGTGVKQRHITVRDVYGTSPSWAISVIDDQTGPNDIDDLTLQNIHVNGATSSPVVNLSCSAGGTIKISNITEQTNATGDFIKVITYQSNAAVSINRLVVDNLDALQLSDRVIIDIAASATCKDISGSNWRLAMTTANGLGIVAATGTTVNRIALTNVFADTIKSIFQLNAGSPAVKMELANVYMKSCGRIGNASGTGLDLSLANLTVDTLSNQAIFVSGSTLTIRGSGVNRATAWAGIQRAGAEVVHCINADYPIDVGTLTQANGDTCLNTAAATGVLPGAGVLISDGTTWRQAATGAVKTGTATLSGGTIVVADTAITANSIIRVSRKTIGGTAGALFVSALTAATSFAITSTNGADTSVVYYEIVTY